MLFLNILFVSLQILIHTVFVMREMKIIIENGVGRQDVSFILQSGGRMLAFTLLAGICTAAASYFSARIVASVTCAVREDCYKKVLSLSPQEAGRFGDSSLQMRTVTDAMQIQILTINLMRTSMMVPVAILCILILIFRMNKVIFVILAAVFGLTVFGLFYLGAGARPRFEHLQGITDRFNLLMKEKITGVRTIRAFVNEETEEEKTARVNDEICEAAIYANRKINFLSPMSLILMNWAVVLIYLVSSSQLRAGLAGISDLLLIFQYLGYLIATLAVVPVLVNLLPKVSVAVKRLRELLETQAYEENGEKTAREGSSLGEVEFRHVTFGYAGASDVISDVSFSAPPGKTTAFLGMTGSGKTTIMNLIQGFCRATGGEILLDGVPISEADIVSVRRKISCAPQRAMVFQDSVRNNVTMYDAGMSDDRIRQALHAACFDEVLEKLPEGMETVMAQGGMNLSGGQRQRLSLARAVARDAEIYIFDDAFSALDALTEAKVRERLRAALAGKTVLMVAQKISAVREADRIIVMDNGRIAGMGAHEELLENCPEYRGIWETQVSLEEGSA